MRLTEKVQRKLETIVNEIDPDIKVGSPSLNFQEFRIDAPVRINDERLIIEIPKEFIDNFLDLPVFEDEVKAALNDLKEGNAKRIRITDKGRTVIE